jgi:hypothetical protein
MSLLDLWQKPVVHRRRSLWSAATRRCFPSFFRSGQALKEAPSGVKPRHSKVRSAHRVTVARSLLPVAARPLTFKAIFLFTNLSGARAGRIVKLAVLN